MAETFDPFRDLPQEARGVAYRHIRMMRAAGLSLIRFERKPSVGGSDLVLYFGDGKSEDLAIISVFVPR